jgi:hypothetical protein
MRRLFLFALLPAILFAQPSGSVQTMPIGKGGTGGTSVSTAQINLGIEFDPLLASNADTRFPSSKAIRAYVAAHGGTSSFLGLTGLPSDNSALAAALALKLNTSAVGTAAALNVPASGNAASGEVVKGNDSRLTDARTPTTHTHTLSQVSDASAIGRTLMAAIDAAAMRTILGSGTGNGDVSSDNTFTDGYLMIADGSVKKIKSTNTLASLTVTTLTIGSFSGLLGVANGGTGTASPGLVAGTNVTITGTWPNQTVNSSGGGGSGTSLSSTVTQASHGFVAGDIVYNSAGTYAKARADSIYTYAVPYFVESATTNTFVAVPIGRVNITGLGYTAGTYRFLSDSSAGTTSTTAPTAAASFTAPVLYVESTTVGFMNPPYPLSNASGVSVKTTTYTATLGDSVIICNSGSPFTVTLYNATTAGASPLTIKNKGAGTITLDATSLGQIDGSNTITLTQYESVTLVPDGTNWNVN